MVQSTGETWVKKRKKESGVVTRVKNGRTGRKIAKKRLSAKKATY